MGQGRGVAEVSHLPCCAVRGSVAGSRQELVRQGLFPLFSRQSRLELFVQPLAKHLSILPELRPFEGRFSLVFIQAFDLFERQFNSAHVENLSQESGIPTRHFIGSFQLRKPRDPIHVTMSRVTEADLSLRKFFKICLPLSVRMLSG